MTVQELRNRLENMSPDAEVIITTRDDDKFFPLLVRSGYFCKFNIDDERRLTIYDEEILEDEDFNSGTLNPCVQLYIGEI